MVWGVEKLETRGNALKTYYYTDELEDEFSDAKITPKTIDKNYSYKIDTTSKKLAHIFWYHIVAKPLAKAFLWIKYRHKIIGKEKLAKVKNQGFFMYANHTNAAADALIPTMVAKPTEVFVIVHANNVSMPVLGRVTPYLGALPLPDDREALKNFLAETERKISEKKCVMIYPEAHIWPYYTKIRPFTEKSFRYPVQYDCPVMCFTNTYQKRKHGHKPMIVTYVDGPFYPDKNLKGSARKKELRDRVYETMTMRSKNNNIELAKYVREDGGIYE